METYLRDKEVAKMLSIGRSTVWYLVKAGRLPKPIKLSPRITVWQLSTIEEFLSRQS